MHDVDARLRLAYFVPPSAHFAGIERVVHEIADGLMESYGDVLDVHVLYASRYDELRLASSRYTTHVMDIDRLHALAGALRALVAAEDFDVLIAAQVEPSVTAWLATRGLRLPIFVPHLHGNPRIEEADGSLRTRAAFILFRHVISRRVPGILAVSPSLRRYAASAVSRRAEVHFARNPIRNFAEVGARSPQSDRFRFVNVARLSYQKGQDVLLRALALARPDLPPVRMTLVGSGPEETNLRRLSRELGLDDILVFAGCVSDPGAYLRDADCFVLPSRWEGFGVAMVEALRFGLPILATNCDFGPADLVTNRRIGELVEVGNVESLAGGLKAAVRRDADADADALRRNVARDYARNEVTKAHFDILRRIVATRSSRSGRLATFAAA